MNTLNNFHMHIIPTNFCNRNCFYCINSAKTFNYISLEDFEKDMQNIFNEMKKFNFNEIWFEWNGGEFTLVPNIEKYFEIFIQLWIKNRPQINFKKFNIILTTNFQQDKIIYKNIENIISPVVDKYRYFVSLHYDYPLEFIDEIFNYLKNLKDNGEFEINIMKTKNEEYEKINKKFLKKIRENVSIFDHNLRKLLKKHLRLRYSFLVPLAFIQKGQPYLKMSDKFCSGSIYFYQPNGIITNFCTDRSMRSSSFKIEYSMKKCNKSCPGQSFDSRLFKPFYKNTQYQFYNTNKKF